MPRVATPLHALDIKRLGPGFHPVGGVAGLACRVKESGTRSWVLRTMVGDQRKDIGLGSFPEVGLASAREKARDAKERIRLGFDPVEDRRAAKADIHAAQAKERTFKECTDVYLARKVREFHNSKHAAQWVSTLKRYAFPILESLPVSRIDLPHVVSVLEPIWMDKPETASRVRGRIEAVLAFATASGYRSGPNPAAWRNNLSAVLPKHTKLKLVRHHRSLPVEAMPTFWIALSNQVGLSARALQFAILTAARSGEVRGTQWQEINWENETWEVPADRMKTRVQHTVPLSPAAIALLKGLPRLSDTFVFPSPRGRLLSDMSISAVTRRMCVDAVPHGFRSTFRTWCAERTNYPAEVAEQCLAHTIGSTVELAYKRTDFLAKRRTLMTEWSNYLCST